MDVRGHQFFGRSSTCHRFCSSLQRLTPMPVSITTLSYKTYELYSNTSTLKKSIILLNHLTESNPLFFDLFRRNNQLIRDLQITEQGSEELHFSSRFPKNGWEQFKACLWKRHLTYWRSPRYNLGRLIFTAACSLLFGALLWQKGQKM